MDPASAILVNARIVAMLSSDPPPCCGAVMLALHREVPRP